MLMLSNIIVMYLYCGKQKIKFILKKKLHKYENKFVERKAFVDTVGADLRKGLLPPSVLARMITKIEVSGDWFGCVLATSFEDSQMISESVV